MSRSRPRGSDYSRHSQYSRTRVPDTPGNRMLYGERDDRNRYYHCKFCGFICDIERDRLDNGEHGSTGIVVAEFYEVAGNNNGDTLDGISTLDGLVTLANDQSGSGLTTIRHNQYPDVVGGCPFCGSLNWR